MSFHAWIGTAGWGWAQPGGTPELSVRSFCRRVLANCEKHKTPLRLGAAWLGGPDGPGEEEDNSYGVTLTRGHGALSRCPAQAGSMLSD